MRSNTIKSIAAVVLTGLGSALVVGFRTQDAPVLTGSAPITASTGTSAANGGSAKVGSGSGAAGGSSTGATSTPPASTSTTPTYADGTWAGQAEEEPWGTFQVEAVVSGGQITNVVLISAPPDGHSSRINNRAVPALTQAAVAAQSAQIDMVSGATWTSQSYITSLQVALDEARAAAVAAS